MTADNKTEAEVIGYFAQKAQAPMPLEAGRIYSVYDANGDHEVIDTFDYADHPLRITGSPEVLDAESFLEYFDRYHRGTSQIWADKQGAKITAVFDSDDVETFQAGWGRHTLTLRLTPTVAWDAWLNPDLNGKLVDQVKLAEHFEDRLPDIINPDAATMLEIAQSFVATKGVDFASSQRLSNGEVKFGYKETVSAKAGNNNTLEIPEKFALGLKPYEGSEPHRVIARFRYRINEGGLRIGYTVERPEDILSSAFDSVLAAIRGDNRLSDTLIFNGKR